MKRRAPSVACVCSGSAAGSACCLETMRCRSGASPSARRFGWLFYVSSVGFLFLFACSTVQNLGTAKHAPIVEATNRVDIMGCFALTESYAGTCPSACLGLLQTSSAGSIFDICVLPRSPL